MTVSNAGATPAPEQSGRRDASASSTDQPNASGKGATPRSFDEWLSAQPEDARTIVDHRLHSLDTALESERSERKRLERELKRLVKGTDDSNPLKPDLEKLSANVSEQTTRADFFEEAHKRGFGNLRLAYHAAKFEQLIDERGRVDWEGLKEKVPELLNTSDRAQPQKPPPGNAGKGAGHAPPGAKSTTASASINEAIRRAAGRY